MNLKKLVLTSLSWAIGAKALGQLVNWAITLYVIRILSVEDYGLMAIAMGFIAILLPLSELGLGSALVQRKELDDVIIGKTFGFVVLASALCALAFYLFSPLIASLFDAPKLDPVIKVLSLSLIVLSFGIVPRALLQRDLDFKSQSIVDLVSGISGGVVALFMAIRGYGIWALIGSFLTNAIMSSVGLVIIARFWRWPNFNLRGLTDVMSFGKWLTLNQFAWLLWAQADVLIIGKILGERLLGFYSVAKHISILPQGKLQGILNLVAFPAYSKTRQSGENPAYYFVKYLRMSSLVTFPVFAGLSLVAPEFVMLILGEKWQNAILPIQLISLAMPFKVLESAFAPFLYALGHVKKSLGNVLIAFALMVTLLMIGTQGGLAGVASAWAVSTVLIFLVVLYRTSGFTEINFGLILKSTSRGCIPALIMYVSVMLFVAFFEASIDFFTLLLLKVFVGAAVYYCCAWIMCRSEWQEIFALLGVKRPSYYFSKI